MLEKFGRSYSLSIGLKGGGTLVIEPPFTVEFDITRNILTSANVASIRIFNLSENNRNKIRKNVNDFDDQRLIQFNAGYAGIAPLASSPTANASNQLGSTLPLAFSGSISQAWSTREGVNFITQIESFDGGFAFANAKTNVTLPPGTPQVIAIAALAKTLPGVSLGAVGAYTGASTRGASYSGSTVDILREITGGGFFIDNGKFHALQDNEVLVGEVQVINAQSGLLGTPVREDTILHFEMLFEPRLIIGQLIFLQSATDSNFNGFNKVISLKHRGMISEAVCGDAVTSVGMFAGSKALTPVGAG